jgi:predicted DNA-binding transcriptional regulator AlpA
MPPPNDNVHPRNPAASDPRAHLAQLPDDACITAAEFAALAACSVRHIDRLVKAGKAPPPIRNLGSQVRRWRMGVIRAWLEGGAA